MKKGCILPLLVVFFIAKTSYAWWDLGHEVVAQIAASTLTDKARQRVSDLLSVELENPGTKKLSNLTQDIVLASVWADIIKAPAFSAPLGNGHKPPPSTLKGINDPYGAQCHYLDLDLQKKDLQPILEGNTLDKLIVGLDQPSHQNILTCLSAVVQVLEAQEVPTGTSALKLHLSQAVALRYLIHLMGDLHQPLHLVSVSDRGGNWTHTVPVNLKESPLLKGRPNSSRPDSLHALWDGMLGSVEQLGLVRIERASDVSSRVFEAHLEWSAQVASEMMKSEDFKNLSEWVNSQTERDLHAWAIETGRIGIQDGYLKLNGFLQSSPDRVYDPKPLLENEDLHKRVRNQLILAGLRLGRLLNSLFR